MKFIDSIEIRAIGGRGGDGAVSFKSSKGKPKLGPDGGDGGRGGSVYLRGHSGLNTLSPLQFAAHYRAKDGTRGSGQGCRGACGDDLFLDVPLGTTITLTQENGLETQSSMGEITYHGQTIEVSKGGRHGLGNTHWVSSTHQAPEESRPGELGQDRILRLELKLLADVGLCGFPNAGKSTFLSKVSAARPKIADYPFTTLVPQLGVVHVDVDKGDTFVIADVPGLVEGASEGRGLGLQFLKHLERTRLIAFILDVSDLKHTPREAFDILKSELKKYAPELYQRPYVILLNKIDEVDDAAYLKDVENTFDQNDKDLLWSLSGLTGEGLREVVFAMHQKVQSTAKDGDLSLKASQSGDPQTVDEKNPPYQGASKWANDLYADL